MLKTRSDNLLFAEKNSCRSCASFLVETVKTKNGYRTWEWCRRDEKDGTRFLNLRFLDQCPEKISGNAAQEA